MGVVALTRTASTEPKLRQSWSEWSGSRHILLRCLGQVLSSAACPHPSKAPRRLRKSVCCCLLKLFWPFWAFVNSRALQNASDNSIPHGKMFLTPNVTSLRILGTMLGGSALKRADPPNIVPKYSRFPQGGDKTCPNYLNWDFELSEAFWSARLLTHPQNGQNSYS